MLGKLLKYDNKVLCKSLFPLGVGVMLVSLFGSLMMKLNLSISYLMDDNSVATSMIRTAATTLFGFSVIAIISASFVCIFILMQRYYKSLFTDEGYLTFTLPVRTQDILLSKMLSGVLWTLFIVACTAIGVFLIFLFGTSRSLINPEVPKAISRFWQSLLMLYDPGLDFPLFTVQIIILLFVSLCEQLMLIYLAITLGNQVAKKHKVLGSIGMYFVIYAICQTINTVLTTPFTIFGGLNILDKYKMSIFHWALLGATLLCLAYSVAFFAINRYIIKNKLNLE